MADADDDKLQRYIDASARPNTRRSYAAALRHFEVSWGGLLPATASSVARYLAEHSEQLSNSTLRLRLAALAQWHNEHGFPDPTKAPLVRQVLKGIRALHPSQEKQAKPLQLQELEQLDAWLTAQVKLARRAGDQAAIRRLARDRALVLLGFWRGFRSDELVNLRAEFVDVLPGEGMSCFLPRSKGDRQLKGQVYKTPALSRLCPVAAYGEWIAAAGIESGPVFRGIDRWGRLSPQALHPGSVIALVRDLFGRAGLEQPESYSSHSLRRGFAHWASRNGWDLIALMEYVGWKSLSSALKYIDPPDPYARQRVEQALATTLPPAPRLEVLPPVETDALPLEVTLTLEPFSKTSRAAGKVLKLIEAFCLEPHAMVRLDGPGTRYRIVLQPLPESTLDETVAGLLDEMYRIANNHDCALEVLIRDPAGGRIWQ